jgi:uncharacterized membrane protein
MPTASVFLYAYLVGVACSACAASLAELLVRRPAGMREPFVTADHVLRSLALVALAGPYLLFCEIRQTRKEPGLALGFAFVALVFVNGWALALGIVLVEFMSVLTRPL